MMKINIVKDVVKKHHSINNVTTYLTKDEKPIYIEHHNEDDSRTLRVYDDKRNLKEVFCDAADGKDYKYGCKYEYHEDGSLKSEIDNYGVSNTWEPGEHEELHIPYDENMYEKENYDLVEMKDGTFHKLIIGKDIKVIDVDELSENKDLPLFTPFIVCE